MASPVAPASVVRPDGAEVCARGNETENVRKAREFREGKLSLPAAQLAGLEKDLAREGQRELARALHARRLALDEQTAYGVLSGDDMEPPEAFALANRLRGDSRFGLARRVLKRTRQGLTKGKYPKIYDKVFQKSALCTYKDPDLPLAWRLDRAFEILQEPDDLATVQDPETLGLAGGIHKRKWEVDQGRHHLERALFYYLRGYAQGAPEDKRGNVIQYLRETRDAVLDAARDQGYTGINAAFILDQLAHQEEEEARRAGLSSEVAQQRREAARLIREEIIRSVPPLALGHKWLRYEWFFYATVGEAYFGLGEVDASNYEKALEWLIEKPKNPDPDDDSGRAAVPLEVPEWEYETTARQLGRLALLNAPSGITQAGFEESNAGRALARFLGNDEQAARSALSGKFGLALSGGGFRASLFHIGVLARLAELGVLPHVEVLSCVSGGSIIGAHYYLEVKRLLERKRDADITAADYVDIVQRIERDFLAGVQRNLRTRVLAEWTTNLKMIFLAGYSRTLRMGELYERELFSRVPDGTWEGPRWMADWLARSRGWAREARWLNALYIRPLQADGTQDRAFQPRRQNWRRTHKVPELVLNATSLNTGHNWQFTASYMGEPPAPINAEIDANERLRRMWYRDAPARHKRVRLGFAVAASSCVPGLFEPLILDGLYTDRSVRLVDGGVCDNQGVASLLEQDCNVLLVSDASGQMESQAVPSKGVLGVPLRANSVLQARVREAQYSDAASRRRSSLLRGFMFVHLKQDLPGEQIAWRECPSHLRESDFIAPRHLGHDATGYHVAVDIERKLAAIRTDLDSFNDLEACALMASGYRMTEAQFAGESPRVQGFDAPQAQGTWRFLAVEEAMKPRAVAPEAEPLRQRLELLLGAAPATAFKVWNLHPALVATKWALAGLAILLALWFGYARWSAPILPAGFSDRFTVRGLAYALFTLLGTALLAWGVNLAVGRKYGQRLARIIRWRDTLRDVLIGTGMATLGWLVARLHLHVFDRVYLRYGRLK